MTDEIFEKGVAAKLSPRDQAIFDFSVALSQAPSTANADHMAKLRKAGLSHNEILDLVLSTALFGWANRLMHILGDPVRSEAERSESR